MIEEKNAVIESTTLGIEDHGIFSYFIHLKYDGGGQGFGGYSLDEPIFTKDVSNLKSWENNGRGRFVCRRGCGFGADQLLQILKTLEVDTWENLPGKSCRVRAEHSKVHAIGHYLKDKWFSPAELYENVWKEKDPYREDTN